MAGLEGSSQWAVSVGPFTSSSTWGSWREGDPEGAALGPWPGGKQPLNLTWSFSTLSQQALLCQVPLGLHTWGRENIASSYRFPPTCPVVSDKVLEGSGAEKPPQSLVSLGNAHFCKGCRTSGKLPIFQKEKPYHPLQLNILLPSDRSSSWHWKEALGSLLNPASMVTTFTRPPKACSRVWRYLPLLVWLQL